MVEYDNMTVLITAVLCYDLCWMVVLGFLSQPFTFVTQVATQHNTTHGRNPGRCSSAVHSRSWT